MARRATPLLSLLALLSAACGGSETTSSTTSSSSSGGPTAMPEIHFHTDADVERIFYAEQVAVQLSGFEPGADVVLRASMAGYASQATFAVDPGGRIDTAHDAPKEGSYEGVDPDGPFWSMLAVGDPPMGASTDLDVRFEAEVAGKVLTGATLARFSVADGVTETQVTDNGLVAVFVTPGDAGPHPALITFGGSEGGIDSGARLARFYASLGYSCLGLAYFAEDGLPATLAKIPLEYFGNAIAWMKQRSEVKPDAIGVLGGSRGGELALLLGATFPDVKAVVAQVPSGVVWPGYLGGIVSSWTYEGQELPFVTPSNLKPTVVKDAAGHSVKHYTPTFNAALDAASPEEIDAASARAELTQGPILLLAAEDDQVWPSCRLAQIAMDRLVANGHDTKFADYLECYPEAGHFIGSPNFPTTGAIETQHPVTHEWLALGGTPAGLARADRAAYDRKRAFLAAALH